MSGLGFLFLFAALLTVAVGIAHSMLGERYILRPLLRRSELPKLPGSSASIARTLRFAWHITTVGWLGFAAFFWEMAQGHVQPFQLPAAILAFVFLASALLTAVTSRFRHLGWLAFLAIGLIALYGSQA